MPYSIVQVQSGQLALCDESGNIIGVIDDAGSKLLKVATRLHDGSAFYTGAKETGGNLADIKTKTDNIPSDPAKESGKLTTIDSTLTAIKSTDGIKKIVDALPTGSNTIGKVDQGAAGSTAWKTDGSGVTQPVSATALPLPSGAATSGKQDTGNTSLGNIDTKTPALGQAAMAASSPVVIASNQSAVPMSAASLPLPTGAATEATLATLPHAMNGAFNKAAAIGGQLDDTGTTSATEDNVAPVRITPKRAMHVNLRDAAGAEFGNASNPLVVSSQAGASASNGFRDGRTTSSAATPAPCRFTAYTEPTSAGQRSIASASANDAAAGTGARTVKITYYKNSGGTVTGPFYETLTLNGTTGVNTVASDIYYIEQMEVLTVGSGGTNAGIITLYTQINKGGTAIGTIAASEGHTEWAHHYVPSGKTCYITAVYVALAGGGATSGGVQLKEQDLSLANAYDNPLTEFVRSQIPSSGTNVRQYSSAIPVAGPARIVLWINPDGTNNLTWYGSFDYYEQ